VKKEDIQERKIHLLGGKRKKGKLVSSGGVFFGGVGGFGQHKVKKKGRKLLGSINGEKER